MLLGSGSRTKLVTGLGQGCESLQIDLPDILQIEELVMQKVSGVFRAGAAFITICALLTAGLLVFVLLTEPIEWIMLVILGLAVAVAYYAGHVTFKGIPPGPAE